MARSVACNIRRPGETDMPIVRRKDLDPQVSQVGLRDEVNRLFDSFFTPAASPFAASWLPAIDIAETDTSFVVSAELPGMKAEDVDINLTNNILTLQGEKKEEKDETNRNWHRVERSFGSFRRTVQLPDGLDAEKTKATFENGVLKVELAKSSGAKPRTIHVESR
jgi:HSP20 family protein